MGKELNPFPVFSFTVHRRYGHTAICFGVAAHWLWFVALGVAVLAWVLS
jgi:hypothetical protein